MIEIGKISVLRIKAILDTGIYLNEIETEEEADILLYEQDINLSVGERIEVFVYRDSNDQKIATLRKPKLQLGEVAALEVVSINHIGAFLDWGFERDLFLPFKQQVGKIQRGKNYLVGMYVDKSDRLCATMKIYDVLNTNSPYKTNDEVTGTIYAIKEAFGAFVAVANRYHGLIPTKELYGKHHEGEVVSLRVKSVKPDGKLELSLRKPIHFQMEDDVKMIMEALEAHAGKLKLHDKSSPEEIKNILCMSKAAFKRAAGRLMKEGVIEMKSDGIYRNW
ncbi:CvfB family protein [Cellulosilyticum ruminicola]|uniref:CvfB family protein n=1 Tax=Cellulosilyticum ruminicola TaxID=425254 RepID=UPI0006D054D6|nr:S1-like domain-containing RNA-binding protein [Cellulosilyticum ruminicola]